MRKIVTAAATVVAIAATGLVGVGTASGFAGDYTGAGASIRACQYTSCTIQGYGYPGQGAQIECYKNGTSVDGYVQWHRHNNLATGVRGYTTVTLMSWSGGVSICP